MKQIIRKFLPRNRFARSVSILAGGTAAGQGIVVLASPLLTRLYSPDDFGLLAVYASFLGIIGVVASLRYQLAIPLPEKDEEAAHVVVLSLLVVLGMSLLTALVVLFFAQSIAELSNTPALAGYMWLLPVGLLLMGSYQVFYYWAIRTRSFTAIARTKFTQSISMTAMQLGGYALGPLALLLGRVFGSAAGTTSLSLLSIRNHGPIFRNVSLKDVAHAASRYRRFPIFSTWGGFFNTAGIQLPPLLFAAMFSPSAAGIFMLTHRVLAMPMSLIGRAIADVFFSHAIDAMRENRLAPLVAGIHEKLAHIAMPPALILILTGPDLFALTFGDEWRQAGEFAQWMAVFLYFQFIVSPLSQLVSILEKQAQGTIFQASLMAAQLIGILVGILFNSLILSVALFSLGSAFCYFGFLIWIAIATKNKLSVIFWPSLTSLGWSIITASPLIIYLLIPGMPIFWTLSLLTCIILVVCRYIFLFIPR
jgi:O-antigen/teichoic acid export membrane protein